MYLISTWFWAKFTTIFSTACILLGRILIAENGQILKLQIGHMVTLNWSPSDAGTR